MRIIFSMIMLMSSMLLWAITDDISNTYLEVKCNMTDSTQTIKDTFFVGEPIRYSLTILNIDVYSLNYRSSSKFTDIASINVIAINDTMNHISSINPAGLDSLSVLQPNDQLFVTKIVFIQKPGKYAFIVTPHFKFTYDTWPDIGTLNRIFYVK